MAERPKPPRPGVPGIPGAPLPPRRRQPTLPDDGRPAEGASPAPDLDSTLGSPPAPAAAFRERLESRPERHESPPSVVAPWASEREREASRRHAEERGGALVKPPESVSYAPPRPRSDRYGEPRWWQTAKGMAVVLPVLAATVTGILGGLTTAVVVPIIKAAREPYEGATAKDIAEAKKAGERCDAAVTSERAARLASEKELADDLHEANGRISELARGMPVVKPDPGRAPRKP